MINNQEAIDRYADAYKVLVNAGIFASTFEGSYQLPREPWEMHFSMLRPIGTDLAKVYVTKFLQDEYQATDIKFFRDGASEVRFYASFKRGDC